MHPTTSLLRVSRSFAVQQTPLSVFRAQASSSSSSSFSSSTALRSSLRFQSRRWASTASGEASGSSSQGQPQQAQSWFQRMWDSPIGLKTVHFWAPVMKWALVIAGIADFTRPAEKLSLTQNMALTATGTIWTRWCFVIKPQNYLLAAVNFFLGVVGVVQVSRIATYNFSQKKKLESVKEEGKKAVNI